MSEDRQRPAQGAGPRGRRPRSADRADQVLDALLAVLCEGMDATSGQLRALRVQLRSAGAAVTPGGPGPALAGTHVELGEMFGRSDVRYRDLVSVFSVRNQAVQPLQFSAAEVVRAYGQVNSRRFLCVLLLMADQLVTRGQPAQSGLPIRALRGACQKYGIPDAHANLYRDLVSTRGLEVERSTSGRLVRLQSDYADDGRSGLSVAAKELCALAVRSLAPFVVRQ